MRAKAVQRSTCILYCQVMGRQRPTTSIKTRIRPWWKWHKWSLLQTPSVKIGSIKTDTPSRMAWWPSRAMGSLYTSQPEHGRASRTGFLSYIYWSWTENSEGDCGAGSEMVFKGFPGCRSVYLQLSTTARIGETTGPEQASRLMLGNYSHFRIMILRHFSSVRLRNSSSMLLRDG